MTEGSTASMPVEGRTLVMPCAIAIVTAPTSAPGATQREVAALQQSGSALFLRTPGAVDVAQLMDPAAVPQAIEMGRRQGAADADELRAFLA